MPILFACLQRRKTGWADLELAVTEVIAVVWSVFVIGLLCVPPVLPADSPSSIPWSGPIMGMVAVLALVDWTVRGHKEYAPIDTQKFLTTASVNWTMEDETTLDAKVELVTQW
jgi:hypothetical protein